MTKIIALHVITKVLKLVAKGQMSLVTMLKMALFALRCVDMVVNDQDNDLHVVTKVLKLVTKGQKSLVTMLIMAKFALKCIDMVVNDQDNNFTCHN